MMGGIMPGPLTILMLEAHAAGEPRRIILAGFPEVAEAVVPEVSGSACLTGACEFWIDPAGPLRHGFILR